MSEELQAAIAHLDTYGYCLLPARLPREEALDLGARCLALHDDPACADAIVGNQYYQTLFGMLNLDDRVWQCAFHRDTLAIARHFLGSCRVVEACSKPCWPGAPAQALHVDSAHHFHQVPDVPWMINTIWMLSDFTVENGATGIVPLSHRSRLKTPPPEVGHDSELIAAVVRRFASGSISPTIHGGLTTGSRADTSRCGRRPMRGCRRNTGLWCRGGRGGCAERFTRPSQRPLHRRLPRSTRRATSCRNWRCSRAVAA